MPGSYGHTKVLFGPIAALGVTGSSVSFGGDIAALLVVNPVATVTATGSVQTSLSRTQIGGESVVENDTLNASLGVVATYSVPGFSAQIQAQLTRADVREKLSGSEVAPILYQGSASIAKALVPRVQARLRGDWQLTTADNLPGVLQYQIGGVRSARAFSPGIAAGDNGFSASAELSYGAFWDGLAIEPYLFVDHAQASIPGQRFASESAGAGLNLTHSPRLTTRATIATDIGRSGGLPSSTRAFVSTTVHL